MSKIESAAAKNSNISCVIQSDKKAMLRNLLFHIALAIELILVIVDESELRNPYTSYVFRITFVMTLIVVLLTDYTKRQWAVIILMLIVGVISYRLSGRNEMLRFTMFIAACKSMDLKRMMKLSFYITLTGCVIVALLSVTGIFGAVSLSQDYGRSQGVISRYTLGFGHPNALQCMSFMLILLVMYIYDERMKWYSYLLLLLANFGIYILSDSRTGFLLATGSIIIAAVMHYAAALKKSLWVYLCGIIVLLASVAFSVWAAYFSKNCWTPELLVDKIDHVLNGRIVQLYWQTNAHEGAFETWRIFSTHESQAYFDMGWVRLFYWYGIIPAIIAIAILILVLVQCYRKRNGQAFVLIVVLSVYTILEAHLVSEFIGRNFLLLIIGAYWLDVPILTGKRE